MMSARCPTPHPQFSATGGPTGGSNPPPVETQTVKCVTSHHILYGCIWSGVLLSKDSYSVKGICFAVVVMSSEEITIKITSLTLSLTLIQNWQRDLTFKHHRVKVKDQRSSVLSLSYASLKHTPVNKTKVGNNYISKTCFSFKYFSFHNFYLNYCTFAFACSTTSKNFLIHH